MVSMKRRDLLKYIGFSSAALAVESTSLLASRSGASALSAPAVSAFRFNQTGYLPHSEKRVSVCLSGPGASEFRLFAKGNSKPVFRGKLSAPVADVASGDSVAIADFSGWTRAGLYRLEALGQKSDFFSIAADAYAAPLRLAMRAYYGQRCGCAVDLGDGYSHPACHLTAEYHASSGLQGPCRNHGGWHDAGDYGRYIVNSGISTGTLLWAWEMYPKSTKKLGLNLPESGGKVPDMLAEIRWNLDWMRSLQDLDGGVWHKQTSEGFCGFILPQDDTLTSYIIGTGTSPFKSTCATADFAAVMAIAARCFVPYDADYSHGCLEAAERAWKWAVAHAGVIFKNPAGVSTGEYGDSHCEDEMLWAAAELWRTTGSSDYEKAYLAGAEILTPEKTIKAPNWANLAPMAHWTYALSDRKGSLGMKARVLRETSAVAESLNTRQNASGYGTTMAPEDYGWGSNSDAANQSLLLLVAHQLQPNLRYVQAALGNLHYLLGRNCFGVSWVTQVGTNPFQHPHHRPSAADSIPAPWPGMLSGGPNAHPADEVARTLPKMPPMRMWIDEERAYSMNEIAINWNAPLVFLLAAANAVAS